MTHAPTDRSHARETHQAHIRHAASILPFSKRTEEQVKLIASFLDPLPHLERLEKQQIRAMSRVIKLRKFRKKREVVSFGQEVDLNCDSNAEFQQSPNGESGPAEAADMVGKDISRSASADMENIRVDKDCFYVVLSGDFTMSRPKYLNSPCPLGIESHNKKSRNDNDLISEDEGQNSGNERNNSGNDRNDSGNDRNNSGSLTCCNCPGREQELMALLRSGDSFGEGALVLDPADSDTEEEDPGWNHGNLTRFADSVTSVVGWSLEGNDARGSEKSQNSPAGTVTDIMIQDVNEFGENKPQQRMKSAVSATTPKLRRSASITCVSDFGEIMCITRADFRLHAGDYYRRFVKKNVDFLLQNPVLNLINQMKRVAPGSSYALCRKKQLESFASSLIEERIGGGELSILLDTSTNPKHQSAVEENEEAQGEDASHGFGDTGASSGKGSASLSRDYDGNRAGSTATLSFPGDSQESKAQKSAEMTGSNFQLSKITDTAPELASGAVLVDQDSQQQRVLFVRKGHVHLFRQILVPTDREVDMYLQGRSDFSSAQVVTSDTRGKDKVSSGTNGAGLLLAEEAGSKRRDGEDDNGHVNKNISVVKRTDSKNSKANILAENEGSETRGIMISPTADSKHILLKVGVLRAHDYYGLEEILKKQKSRFTLLAPRKTEICYIRKADILAGKRNRVYTQWMEKMLMLDGRSWLSDMELYIQWARQERWGMFKERLIHQLFSEQLLEKQRKYVLARGASVIGGNVNGQADVETEGHVIHGERRKSLTYRDTLPPIRSAVNGPRFKSEMPLVLFRENMADDSPGTFSKFVESHGLTTAAHHQKSGGKGKPWAIGSGRSGSGRRKDGGSNQADPVGKSVGTEKLNAEKSVGDQKAVGDQKSVRAQKSIRQQNSVGGQKSVGIQKSTVGDRLTRTLVTKDPDSAGEKDEEDSESDDIRAAVAKSSKAEIISPSGPTFRVATNMQKSGNIRVVGTPERAQGPQPPKGVTPPQSRNPNTQSPRKARTMKENGTARKTGPTGATYSMPPRCIRAKVCEERAREVGLTGGRDYDKNRYTAGSIIDKEPGPQRKETSTLLLQQLQDHEMRAGRTAAYFQNSTLYDDNIWEDGGLLSRADQMFFTSTSISAHSPYTKMAEQVRDWDGALHADHDREWFCVIRMMLGKTVGDLGEDNT